MELKPNKTNVVGTVLLLTADWIGGLSSSLFKSAMGVAPGVGKDLAASSKMAASMNIGGFNIVGSTVSIIVTAVLFYVIVSFIASRPFDKGKK